MYGKDKMLILSLFVSVEVLFLEHPVPCSTGKDGLPSSPNRIHRYQELTAQWHPTRNGTLTPEQVTAGSHKKVWWRCSAGHEWQAEIKSRTNGSGCPYCTNRALLRQGNDLATTHPMLAAQWHAERNVGLTPADVVAGSKRRVWWQCEKGHVWRTSVALRAARGCGCPVCAGKKVCAGENDLGTVFPALAAQWDPEKNGAVTPMDVTAYSNRRAWWRCSRGHSFAAAISARATRHSDCPYCTGRKPLAGFNDLATVQPQIAAQWHPTLNGALTPEQVTVGSHKMVWWQCADGHVWKSVVFSRAGKNKCGCPVCAGRVKEANNQRTM